MKKKLKPKPPTPEQRIEQAFRDRPFTHREKLFVKEYLKDQNGTRSAIAAGYSKNKHTAGKRAIKLLARAKIRALVKKELAAREVRVRFGADDVLRQIRHISNADIAKCFRENGDLKPIREIPVYIRKAIAGVDVETKTIKGVVVSKVKKIRFWDKTRALEMYGRHYKLFTDKVEATGKDGAPLQAESEKFVVILPAKDKK